MSAQPESASLPETSFKDTVLGKAAVAGAILAGAISLSGNAEAVADITLPAAPTPVQLAELPSVAHRRAAPPDCTTIRRRPKEIIMGWACTNNAKADIIAGTVQDKGWAYSAISINGIYKCGYVRSGVLPTFKPRPRTISHCQEYYYPIVSERHFLYKIINCKEIAPGLEGCRDATPKRAVRSTCRDRHIYGNFQTDEPSPFNVFGTGNGGFTQQRYKKHQTAVGFRAQTQLGSRLGKADVVRGSIWGFMRNGCAKKVDLNTGTPTIVPKP